MHNNHKNPRAGIALVMVLGVLSLMILMAVSFAISMRTERVAAGNYVDTVRARQLAQAALVRAMDDILFLCGSNALDPYYLPYPDWTVTNSWTSEQANVAANLLKGSASNFVPRALWAAATDANDPLLTSNYWIKIHSVTGVGTNRTTNLVGRVSYMILNCSGLLDANFAGGITPPARGIGTNPVEIRMDKSLEISAKYTDFIQTRSNDVRYETQAELNELGDFFTPATNLFVFSRAPAGFLSNAPIPFIGTQVNLAGGFSDLINRAAQITNAFIQCGFTPEQAGCLFTNLINYVDTGREPVDVVSNVYFNSPATKPVPMINEIVISNNISKLLDVPGPGTITYKVEPQSRLLIEFWIPFVAPFAATYSVEASCDLHTMGMDIPLGPKEQINLIPHNQEFARFELPLTNMPPITLQTATDYNDIPMSIDNLKITVFRPAGADPREDVDVFTNQTFSVSVTNILVNNATSAAYASIECLDPRFNHDVNQWIWTGSPSLDNTNHCTTNFWAANPDCDTNALMHSKTQPLQSVGELGYLAYAPWRTIKLYGPTAHPVLDYFSIGTNTANGFVTSNTVWRGRINPNSIQPEVLATVFAEMPIDEYLGQPGAMTVRWDPTMMSPLETQAMATALFVINNGPYTNLSDVCRLNWATHFSEVYPTTVDNELKREAFIRNTAGLFSTRGQVFTVLIEAHVASGGNVPRRPSRQRAVAVVWRDAWTSEMGVRYLKWLKD